jgi:hypothetical protein
MSEGELAAVFKGLAEDAGEAGGEIAESIAKFTDETADIEDANVARTLAADASTAHAASTIGKEAGSEVSSLGPDAGAAGETLTSGATLTGSGGWTGAGHVESSSFEEEEAYAAIRASTDDVPKIAENTGIEEDVIGQVKNHLFMIEHDVAIGPNEVAHGYFTADGQIASLWNKAQEGSLSPNDLDMFRSLMSHEYVESRLMELGMPYRSADPEAWENGDQLFNPSHFGAHDVAPVASDGSLRQWPALGLTPPKTGIAADLSNIDMLVSAAREGLKL